MSMISTSPSVASMSSRLSSDTKASAAMFALGDAPLSISTFTPATTPVINTVFVGLLSCQCAPTKASAICLARFKDSRSFQYGKTWNGCPLWLDIKNLSRANCASSKWRAASLCSSAIILSCCPWLIPSSNANSEILQNVSTTIPQITSHMAMRWRRDDWVGDSHNIPQPTAIVATMSPPRNPTWVRSGWLYRIDKTAFAYAAIIGAAFLIVLGATVGLARAILSGLRK